jgi:hypothetical protein
MNPLLLCTVYYFCCIFVNAKAESMMQAFQNFKNQKSNNGALPDHLRGVVCERSGNDAKSIYCYNKHGVRCSQDFLNEHDGCKPSISPCINIKLEPGQTCHRYRAKFGSSSRTHGPCWTKGEVAKTKCPQPCGCVLEGQPKRESDGTMRTETISVGNSGCSSGDTWNKVKHLLQNWNVPHSAHADFEMGAMVDRATFLVFDLFIQPDQSRARYGLSLGAVRCHHNNIEVGYMYTGMWKVDTVNTYRCHWKGGCKDSGIPSESIDKAREALQWYAWKNLQVGSRRRLTTVGNQQLQFDDKDQLQNKVHVPIRRSLRGDFFSINDEEETDQLFDEEDDFMDNAGADSYGARRPNTGTFDKEEQVVGSWHNQLFD